MTSAKYRYLIDDIYKSNYIIGQAVSPILPIHQIEYYN